MTRISHSGWLAGSQTFTRIRRIPEMPGLAGAGDSDVWAYAAAHGLVIVSKDSDFVDLSRQLGYPPKVVWIRRGNCATSEVESILRERHNDLLPFESDESTAAMILF
jgi:predicted nuclease of predicted toxin-antitoxin system